MAASSSSAAAAQTTGRNPPTGGGTTPPATTAGTTGGGAIAAPPVGAPAAAPLPAAAPAAAPAPAGGGGAPVVAPAAVLPPAGGVPPAPQPGGGAPGGPPPPPGGGGAPPPVGGPQGPPTNYLELFTRGPPTGGPNYDDIELALGGNLARGHAQVMSAAVAVGSRPTRNAYLFLVVSGVAVRAHIGVCMDRHLDMPGSPPTGYHDAYLLQDGDVFDVAGFRHSKVVTVPNDAFSRRTVRALTEAEQAQQVAGGFDLDQGLAAIDPADPGEDVAFRRIVCVPAGLAALILPRSGNMGLVDLEAAVTNFEAAENTTYPRLRALMRAAVMYSERPIQALVRINNRTDRYLRAHDQVADWRTIPSPRLLDVLFSIRDGEFQPPDMPEGFAPSDAKKDESPPTDATGLSSLTGSAGQGVSAAPVVHVHLPDGVISDASRSQAGGGGGGGSRGGGGGGGGENRMDVREDESGSPAGTDENLKSKLKGKAMSQMHKRFEADWPKVGGKQVCLPFLVTGRCYAKCGRKHLNKSETTAEIYQQMEKICQKIGSLN